nr:hypothetical protein L203_00374 [Cryptococcus depauperatus CBS 7841]
MSTSLATSSHFNLPPPKLHIVRNPAIRIRQAVRDNNVTLLQRLASKVDLRNPDRNRVTSLAWAALESSLKVFEWLLFDYCHDDQELSRDTDNNTILHLLASVPSLTLSPHNLLILSSELPPYNNPLSSSEQSQMALAMTIDYLRLFSFLIDWSNNAGKTALHIAAQAGNTPFINLLCDMGADVDLTDLSGNTPLHYAAAWGHLEVIKTLLERGCQFSARNYEGFTASEYSYSSSIMNSLQNMVRKLFEERRTRRKEEIRERSERETARTRSGSISTSASLGSAVGGSSVDVGSYSSSHGRYLDSYPNLPLPPPAISTFTTPSGTPGTTNTSTATPPPPERSSSLPMIRRGSDQASLAPTNRSRLGTSPPTPQLAQPPLAVVAQGKSVPFSTRYPTVPGSVTSSAGVVPNGGLESKTLARPSASIGFTATSEPQLSHPHYEIKPTGGGFGLKKASSTQSIKGTQEPKR